MSHDPNYVKWVQRSLNRIMKKKLTINGIREGNPEYTGAIAEFKAIYGVDEPGLTNEQIGPKCQDAIIRFNNIGGDGGDYIAWLCQVVPNAPVQAAAVTDKLQAAVRKFQQDNKLQVDGWVGYKTELLLIQISKKDPPGSKPGDTPKGGNLPSPGVPAAPNGITDYIAPWINENPSHANLIKNRVGTVASETLGKIKGIKGLSYLVEPLIWYYSGGPSASDVFLYGAALIPPLSLAAGAVGVWKSIVDDKMLDKVKEIEHDEPNHLKDTIFPTATYYWGEQPHFAAVRIARMGGVSWQHPNGLWVFSKLEKNGKAILTCDTRPKKSIGLIGPQLPLRWGGDGYVWRTYK